MTGRLRTLPLLHRLVGVVKPWLLPLLSGSDMGLTLRKDLEVPPVPDHARSRSLCRAACSGSPEMLRAI